MKTSVVDVGDLGILICWKYFGGSFWVTCPIECSPSPRQREKQLFVLAFIAATDTCKIPI